MDHDYELDTFGLSCPMPLMMTKEELKNIPDGKVLKITASDEGIIGDLIDFCKRSGDEFLSYETNPPEFVVYVRKGGRKKEV